MALQIGSGISVGGGISFTAEAPVIVTPNPTSSSPTSGPDAGGTVVVLSGSGFTGTTSMAIAYPGFVSNDVTSFIVNDDTQITFISPNNAYVPGSGYVIRVVNSAGTGELSGWTYT